VVSVRPFNIYGPGQVAKGAIQKFIKRPRSVRSWKSTAMVPSRSWCYISDFRDGISLASIKKPPWVKSSSGNPQAGITIARTGPNDYSFAQSKSRIVFVPD